jgi:tetratricopeptide (TPR) repeat protein
MNADPSLFDTAEGQYAYALWKRHGHSAQVETMARHADDLARTSPAIPRTWLVAADTELAQYLIEENRVAEAGKLLDEALARERSFAHPSGAIGPVLATMGSLRAKQGDFVGAERDDRQYRDEMLRQYGPNHAASIEAVAVWSVAASRLGHLQAADDASRNALETARRLFPADGAILWRPCLSRAWVLNDLKRFREAEVVARESLRSWPATAINDPHAPQSWGEIGVALAGEKRFAEAVPALETSQRELLAIPGWGPSHPVTVRVQRALAIARVGLDR